VADHPRPRGRRRDHLLTTQYLEEADQLADRIAVLDRGKLIAQGTSAELKRLLPGGHIRLQFADASGLESAARLLGEVSRDDDQLILQVPSDGGVRSLRALLDRLDDESIVVDGYRPAAGPVEWIAAIGVLAMTTLALTWLSVALGMVTKSVEIASNLPMPLMLLPFLGSGFVPTDSMPAGMRWFAEHQPFTPIIETVRGLLMGTAIGSSAVVAVASGREPCTTAIPRGRPTDRAIEPDMEARVMNPACHDRDVAVPLECHTAGRLEFRRGASSVVIRADAAMPDLFRAHFEGPVPEVAVEGDTVVIRHRRLWPAAWVRYALLPGHHAAHLALNASLPWQVDVRGGGSRVDADLRGLQLAGRRVYRHV
jgi:hypothetical protein